MGKPACFKGGTNVKKKLTLLVAAVLLLTACGGGGANGGGNAASNNGGGDGAGSDVIKLGGIIPKTGDVAVYGNTAENGIKLALEEIKANGGIMGKEVEYVSYDDKGDPTEAVNIYGKLIDEGVNAIVGAITSKPTLAVAEMAAADGIPMITPTGTQANITEGKANVFRTCFTDPYQGVLLANFAVDSLKAKTAAVLRNTSSDYSNGIADQFVKTAKEKGLEIVADEGYSDTDNDFKAQLTNINGKAPDVLLIPDYYEKDALITVQARQVGFAGTFLGGDGWDGIVKTLDASNHKDIEGSYFTNHFSVKDSSEKVQSFVKAYSEKYGEDPSAFSALGYDAVFMLKDAFEGAKSTDFAKVTEAMKGLKFDGITGSLTFDENNNPVKAGTIIKIVNGEYTFDSVVQPESK